MTDPAQPGDGVVLHLPFVFETRIRKKGRLVGHLTSETHPFLVPSARGGGFEHITIERDGGTPLRYLRRDGRLWCRMTSPERRAVPAAKAGLYAAARIGEVVQAGDSGLGTAAKSIDILAVGRRADGSFYPRRAPGPLTSKARASAESDDRGARIAEVSRMLAVDVAVVDGQVWRVCAPPCLFIAAASDSPQGIWFAGRFKTEGLPASGAAAAWPLSGIDGYRRMLARAGAGPQTATGDDLSGTPDGSALAAAAPKFDGLVDLTALNIAAIAARLRSGLGEFLPWMSRAAFELWIDVRDAEEIHAMRRDADSAAAYFTALERFAGARHVGDDAQSASARGRWGRLSAEMVMAVARHRGEG